MSLVFVSTVSSLSKRYALYRDGRPLLEGIFERTALGYQYTCRQDTTSERSVSCDERMFADACATFAHEVKKYLVVHDLKLDAIGLRVVSAGSFFQKHRLIDGVFLSLLREKEATAPLHIPFVLGDIQQLREQFPGIKIAAVSDTAFHATMPPEAREYSLSREDARELDIHRFGYHGLSAASVVDRIHSVIGKDPERLVVCHVGSGVSVSAIKNGTSVDSTSGYGTLSSLPMETRGGDVDAGALLALMQQRNLRPSEASAYLHTKAGLTALSGTNDIRIILDRKSQGDATAAATLRFLTYSIQKAIASATVALGGMDTLVLTGFAATRSPELRRLICENLRHFGLGVDDDKNDMYLGKEGVISQPRSLIKVVVMKGEEMREIARVASDICRIEKTE